VYQSNLIINLLVTSHLRADQHHMILLLLCIDSRHRYDYGLVGPFQLVYINLINCQIE